MDGDYSVFAILPPYNNIHAQLIDPNGKLVVAPGGITVSYEGVVDGAGSVNRTSAGKTNFWQYAASLFGVALAVDTGLTGNSMPAQQPQPMKFETAYNWFTADGIPLTPFDDARNKNYYSMMKLVARDAAGNVLASTSIVLPVSDEMDCRTCHASGSQASAKPRAGWAWDPLVERDFKLNILARHDDLHSGAGAYQTALSAVGYNTNGLYATATGGKPVLCAACHASNALGTTGQLGTPPLTAALHGFHANQLDPVAQTTLGASDNRSACYRCHPGAETRCLRGVMGNSVAADGTPAIQCQSCHGDMAAVGDPARQGWLNEPACQSCHTGTAAANAGAIRFTSALDGSGNPRAPADQTFATTANVPAAGFSLYRFSHGHGGLACEACHGSTHAEYPSSQANDNVQSTALQGHVGTIGECSACHATLPGNSGPHGMHPVGSTWVSQHQSAARNAAACQACHGTDYKGTVLSRAMAGRSLSAFGTLNLWRGFQVGCYTCHMGPGNDNRNSNTAPVVSGGSISTAAGTPATLALSATDANSNPLTLWVVSQPANGSVGLAGTTATFTPRQGFEGSDSFTVAAWDGQTSSNLASVQVNVKASTRPVFAATDVANAASFQSGPVSPGETVMIKGAGLGPDTPATMFINSAGLVNRSLAGTRVLFDFMPAPILYTSAGQVNAVVPWGLAAKSANVVNVTVEYNGIPSAPVTMNWVVATPAIFPGAVVNPDGSLNSATSPAVRGSYVTLYGTGAGPQSPTPYDGEISAPPLATPDLAPVVTVGGVTAQVLYIGAAPGLVSGALQLNVQVPDTAPSGNAVPLRLTINGVDAPVVNIAVK